MLVEHELPVGGPSHQREKLVAVGVVEQRVAEFQ